MGHDCVPSRGRKDFRSVVPITPPTVYHPLPLLLPQPNWLAVYNMYGIRWRKILTFTRPWRCIRSDNHSSTIHVKMRTRPASTEPFAGMLHASKTVVHTATVKRWHMARWKWLRLFWDMHSFIKFGSNRWFSCSSVSRSQVRSLLLMRKPEEKS